jgi:hypothetical protein
LWKETIRKKEEEEEENNSSLAILWIHIKYFTAFSVARVCMREISMKKN